MTATHTNVVYSDVLTIVSTYFDLEVILQLSDIDSTRFFFLVRVASYLVRFHDQIWRLWLVHEGRQLVGDIVLLVVVPKLTSADLTLQLIPVIRITDVRDFLGDFVLQPTFQALQMHRL